MIFGRLARGRGAIAAWSPASLSPVGWFTAEDSYVNVISDRVAEWTNRGSAGGVVDQSNSDQRPRWNTTLWPGGTKSIVWPLQASLGSASSGLTTPFTGSAKPFTVMTTVSVFDFDIARSIVAWQNTAQSVCQTSNLGRTRYIRVEDAGAPQTVTAAGTGLTATQIHRVVWSFDGSNITAWVDGAMAINNVSATSANAATLGQLRFGDGPTSSEDSFVGAVVEVVICDYAVIQGDVDDYQTWSTTEWGVGSLSPTIVTPTYVSSGSIAEGTTSIAVPYPSSPQADDVIFIHATSRTASCLPAGLAGWNTFATDTFAGGRQQNVYWKRSVGGETGTQTVTFDNTADSACAAMHMFRNVRRSLSDVGIAEASGDADSAANAIAPPSLAATGNNRLAVAFFCADENIGTSLTITGQSGGTWVHRFTAGSSLGGNTSIHLNTASMASGGTISGGSVVFGGSTDGTMRAFLLKGFYDV